MSGPDASPRLPDTSSGGWLGKLLAALTTGVLIFLGLTFSLLLLVIGVVGGLLAWGFVHWKLRQIRKRMEAHLAAAQAQSDSPFSTDGVAAGTYEASAAREERTVRIIEGEVIRTEEQPPLR